MSDKLKEHSDVSGDQVLGLLENYLDLSKTELVELIEVKVSESLGHEMREAFKIVRSKQQIRSGEINLDRTHKSALVLIAFALNHTATENSKT
ncbi:MAG: hypothetical protein LC778_19435 [Acidobacteria bacterium]|nr:hypothetical protein [Acidobacteriota bacterium]